MALGSLSSDFSEKMKAQGHPRMHWPKPKAPIFDLQFAGSDMSLLVSLEVSMPHALPTSLVTSIKRARSLGPICRKWVSPLGSGLKSPIYNDILPCPEEIFMVNGVIGPFSPQFTLDRTVNMFSFLLTRTPGSASKRPFHHIMTRPKSKQYHNSLIVSRLSAGHKGLKMCASHILICQIAADEPSLHIPVEGLILLGY